MKSVNRLSEAWVNFGAENYPFVNSRGEEPEQKFSGSGSSHKKRLRLRLRLQQPKIDIKNFSYDGTFRKVPTKIFASMYFSRMGKKH